MSGRAFSNYHDGLKDSTCYFCGRSKGIEEHHVIPKRFEGPDIEENIVELCPGCHKKIERLYDRSFYEWFGIKDKKGDRHFHRQCDQEGCKNRRSAKIQRQITIDGKTFEIYNDGVRKNRLLRTTRGFFCKRCLSRISLDIFNDIMEQYRVKRSNIHRGSRFHRDNPNYTYDKKSGTWKNEQNFQQYPYIFDDGSRQDDIEKPNICSPEDILDLIVIEEEPKNQTV